MSSVWAVTSYYNPAGFRIKKKNYLLFKKSLEKQGVPLITMEMAEGASDLENDKYTYTIQGKAALWQKERLLNLGIEKLPKECRYAVWLDCDVIFSDENWAAQAEKQLEKHMVIQPFEAAVRLPKDHTHFQGEGESWNSFAKVFQEEPNLFLFGEFDAHGHSGFAWGARRELFKNNKLYDFCILGSGDHMMAHAFAGDWQSYCIRRIFKNNKTHLMHFQAWAKKIYGEIKANIGTCTSTLYHLWHGDAENRKYVSRNWKLSEFKFNPDKDVKIGKSGLFEWNSDKIELHKYCENYFLERKEDGI